MGGGVGNKTAPHKNVAIAGPVSEGSMPGKVRGGDQGSSLTNVDHPAQVLTQSPFNLTQSFTVASLLDTVRDELMRLRQSLRCIRNPLGGISLPLSVH